jgi:hypothetical protein
MLLLAEACLVRLIGCVVPSHAGHASGRNERRDHQRTTANVCHEKAGRKSQIWHTEITPLRLGQKEQWRHEEMDDPRLQKLT